MFSAYDLSGKLTPLWTYFTYYAFLDKAAQKPPPDMTHQKLEFRHVACGGVSTGSWWAHVYSHVCQYTEPLNQPVDRCGHDLRAIVDTMAQEGVPCKAPNDTPHTRYLVKLKLGQASFMPEVCSIGGERKLG